MPLLTGRARRGRAALARTDQPVVWGREKLLAVLVGGVVVVALLGAGLVLAVVDALRPSQDSSCSPPRTGLHANVTWRGRWTASPGR